MFFPVRTDRRNKRVPWVNYALIALNVVIFMLTARQVASFGPAAAQGLTAEQIRHYLPVVDMYLWPTEPRLFQFITYQFLHQDWMHLLGNMLFLWVFGNSVEDRLGKIGYLLFYLAGGVLAGVAHALPSDAAPVLGASGAVASVTGAYLALFPLSDVTIVFIFGGSFEVSSMVLIGFRIAQDVLFQLAGIGGVAYLAHLGGYAAGFAVGMALLATRLLPREPVDMLAFIEHRRRRRQFQRMARRGFHAWDHAPTEPASSDGAAPRAPAPTPESQALMQHRADITRALAEHRLTEAARLYSDLLRDDPKQVFAQQPQLDLANQLMADGRYDTAAAAYELMLAAYPRYAQRHHVQLILGLIYARYLDAPTRARTLLNEALPHLNRDDQSLAHQVLSEIPST